MNNWLGSDSVQRLWVPSPIPQNRNRREAVSELYPLGTTHWFYGDGSFKHFLLVPANSFIKTKAITSGYFYFNERLKDFPPDPVSNYGAEALRKELQVQSGVSGRLHSKYPSSKWPLPFRTVSTQTRRATVSSVSQLSIMVLWRREGET